MITVTAIGRLTRDPDIRNTSGGSVCSFDIACNFYYRDGKPTYMNCTVWKKLADYISQNAKKGDEVLVMGDLHQDFFESDGQKKSKYKINVATFKMISGKSQAVNSNKQQNNQHSWQPSQESNWNQPPVDEPPF